MKTCFDFIFAKKKYRNALKKGNHKMINNLKEKLEDALYIKIEAKKDFKKLIQ